MRPRPKYTPYSTRKERSLINMNSYHKVINNLHTNPRRFDVITPDINGSRGNLPDIAMSSTEQYKLLLLKNPFYKHTERDEIMLKVKLDPTWQTTAATGLAPKKLIASRSADPMSLPLLREAQIKPMSRGYDKSVRFHGGSQEHLPQIGGKGGAVDRRKIQTAEPGSRPVATNQTLPVLGERADGENISAVAKANKTRPATSTGSRSTKSRLSSASSSLSSLSDDDSYSQSAGVLKRTTKNKMATGSKNNKEGYSKKKEDSKENTMELKILDDPNFRRGLLAELDGKRLARNENSKWGLVANAFKASTFLKIQMPDVIKDSSTSKRHNRALEQVQERIKAREAAAAKEERVPFSGGSNLLQSKGMSQSMPVLTK